MHKDQWQPVAGLDIAKKRARMLHTIRAFFYQRDVLEVDTPTLSHAAITDPNIDSFQTAMGGVQYYLQTSPEFPMKRLLAGGFPSIYQVCKVYRLEEIGPMHNPEFSMLEWYRAGFDDAALIAEIEVLLQMLGELFAKSVTITNISYQQAFLDSLNIDPLTATVSELKNLCLQEQLEIPQGMDDSHKDEWLDWLLTQCVIPAFDKNSFTFLTNYPASQCALAKIREDDSRVAARFELFYGELELANGFYELTDAAEQRDRFIRDNQVRMSLQKPAMPLDENLLSAMQHGLPECAGVAVGLDRLLMVLTGAGSIAEVLAFPFDRA